MGPDIDREGQIPHLVRRVHRILADGHAGVGEEHLHRPELRFDTIDQRRHRARIGHIGRHREVPRAQLAGHTLEWLHVGDGHPGALRGASQRHRPPNSPGRARDHDGPPTQPHVRPNLSNELMIRLLPAN